MQLRSLCQIPTPVCTGLALGLEPNASETVGSGSGLADGDASLEALFVVKVLESVEDGALLMRKLGFLEIYKLLRNAAIKTIPNSQQGLLTPRGSLVAMGEGSL